MRSSVRLNRLVSQFKAIYDEQTIWESGESSGRHDLAPMLSDVYGLNDDE